MEMTFEHLKNTLLPYLRPAARQYSAGLAADEDDLLNEAFLWLWGQYSRGKLENKNLSWMITACRFRMLYVSKKWRRFRRSGISLTDAEDDQHPLIDVLAFPEPDSCEALEQSHVLALLMESLSPVDQQILEGLLAGKVLREIGRDVGLSGQGVHAHVKKIREIAKPFFDKML